VTDEVVAVVVAYLLKTDAAGERWHVREGWVGSHRTHRGVEVAVDELVAHVRVEKGRARARPFHLRPPPARGHRLAPSGPRASQTFLAEARVRGDGEGLPRFVERELREFLACGDLTRGFARFRCTDCQREILVACSYKGIVLVFVCVV
jgi:hypothetical protein